jgi:hypothetical protein
MELQMGEDILFTLYFAVDQRVIVEDKEDLSYAVLKPQEA